MDEIVKFHKKAFYNSVLVDTIISKSAYLWDLIKLFYIEIYDFLCAKVELSNYKIIKNRQFVYSSMQVGRDKTVRVGLYSRDEDAIVSPAYQVFKVIDENNRFGQLFYYFNYEYLIFILVKQALHIYII